MTQTMVSVGLAVAAIALTLVVCIWWASVARATKSEVAQLKEQTRQLAEETKHLRESTERFRTKLLDPTKAGQWGEIQLQNLVDFSGLLQGRDYVMKDPTHEGEPDMTVLIPGSGGKKLHVDAKTSFKAVLDDAETPDQDSDKGRLRRLVRSMQTHVNDLVGKQYWKSEGSADFVIMYVPNEWFVLAALSEEPELLDDARKKGILIASPLTLLTLLKSYAEGFQQVRDIPAIFDGIRNHARELQTIRDSMDNAVRRLGASAADLSGLEASIKRSHQRTAPDRERFLTIPNESVQPLATDSDPDVQVRSVSDYGG